MLYEVITGLSNREHQDIYSLEIENINEKEITKQIIEYYESIGKTKYKTNAV